MKSRIAFTLLSSLFTLQFGLIAFPGVGQAQTPAAGGRIAITPAGFQPPVLRVRPGETIVWTNLTDEPRSVVSQDGIWDSGPIDPRRSFRLTLPEGSYDYVNRIGPEQAGRVIVEDPPSGPAPSPQAAGPAVAPAASPAGARSTAISPTAGSTATSPAPASTGSTAPAGGPIAAPTQASPVIAAAPLAPTRPPELSSRPGTSRPPEVPQFLVIGGILALLAGVFGLVLWLSRGPAGEVAEPDLEEFEELAPPEPVPPVAAVPAAVRPIFPRRRRSRARVRHVGIPAAAGVAARPARSTGWPSRRAGADRTAGPAAAGRSPARGGWTARTGAARRGPGILGAALIGLVGLAVVLLLVRRKSEE